MQLTWQNGSEQVRLWTHYPAYLGFGYNRAAAGSILLLAVEHNVGAGIYYGYPNVGAWCVPSRRGYFRPGQGRYGHAER